MMLVLIKPLITIINNTQVKQNIAVCAETAIEPRLRVIAQLYHSPL
ncbi:MAG: hypothetical protein H0W88_04670 [Parachlamydiaceae bacterium]|nr:hypothetical protein [Parachlamydiaceae bacterium]